MFAELNLLDNYLHFFFVLQTHCNCERMKTECLANPLCIVNTLAPTCILILQHFIQLSIAPLQIILYILVNFIVKIFNVSCHMSAEGGMEEFGRVSHLNGILVGFNTLFAKSTHREKE